MIDQEGGLDRIIGSLVGGGKSRLRHKGTYNLSYLITNVGGVEDIQHIYYPPRNIIIKPQLIPTHPLLS